MNKAGSLPSSAQQGGRVSPAGSVKAKYKRLIAESTTLSNQDLGQRRAALHLP